VKTQYAVSERHACEVLSINRSSYRYCACRGPIDVTHGELVRLSDRYDYWGYRKIHDLMQRGDIAVGRERVRVIRRREGLQVRQKQHKRKVLGRSTQWVHRAQHPNPVWSYDFVMDQLADGRRIRILNIVDDFSRVCVGQLVNLSISGSRMARLLDELKETRGLPKTLVPDNGPEMTSKAMFFWSRQHGVKPHFIQPGKPTQNALVESFNGRFRDGCLNQQWVVDLANVRRIIAASRDHYNTVRPHSSFGYMPPALFEAAA
jgi:putative transposase